MNDDHRCHACGYRRHDATLHDCPCQRCGLKLCAYCWAIADNLWRSCTTLTETAER